MAIDITNLKSKLTAKIAALDGTQTLKDLLFLKKACDGTSVDISAIDTRIQVFENGLTSSSTDKDLLFVNKASIESSAVGGGLSIPVNGVIPMQNGDNLITLPTGEVLLKSGITNTEVDKYPDAIRVAGVTPPRNLSGLTSNSAFCMANDGTHIYVCDYIGSKIRKYTLGGAPVATYPLTHGTGPIGITWDGTHFWVVLHSAKGVFKYTSDFTYANVSFSVSAQASNYRGLAWGGGHLWLLGEDKRVYKYNSSGTYQNFNFSVTQISTPQGIAYDESNDRIALCNSGTNAIHSWNPLNGTYHGAVAYFSGATNLRGVTILNNNYYVLQISTPVLMYTNKELESVGQPLEKLAYDIFPIYVRIK
ncbi:hypothetical protein [Pseudoalteromonas denitrificans]|uniref:Uncharacterized protein n=1 Tax=Pseudoalteromonas denitrificans DSM 6059 TaxID=1123010 RepID=A0A1I1UUH7_9GAMM|nr:hypothetical protein [Pseudoalteromonas denitrificans]SFD72513.1 hypothetical protein SAMN02745724_05296 [Pseudoalteromonas denitrificans DSM 6059]